MLKGKRVVLRALERSDLPLLHAFNNDLAVELAGGGDHPTPQSMARLEAEFDKNAGNGGRDGENFAIVAEGNFIGICGLYNFDNLANTCEMGIGIGNKLYWGKGYGREAITMLTDYAFRYRNIHKVFLRVHGTNERAQRAYKAVGYVEEGRLRAHIYSNGSYDDLIYMGVLRSEWNLTSE